MLLPGRLLLFFAVILLTLSCGDSDNRLFKQLSPGKSGIDFVNQLAYTDSISVLEFEYMFNGGGVALIDINNDQLQDIIFTGNMVSSRLYLNKGNLEFEDITKEAGVETQGWSNGVAVVDINQDGFLDFYICKAGNYKTPPAEMRNLFFINNGNNTFTESAAKMDLDEDGFDIHTAFFDYDHDGDLDMYLLRNAIVKTNRNVSRVKKIGGEAESTDKLFRNNGDLTFTDVSKEAGITIEGFGLGVSICDINNDNWPDVYVSNDFLSNDLVWINNKNGTFTNKAKELLRHQTYNGMGNDVADYNNDGLPDIMVVDMLPPDNKRWKLTITGNSYDEFEGNLAFGYEPQYLRNTLQLNNGDGTFSEIGRIAGVAATEWSWGPLFADFDNDGWKDMFIANGFRQDINNLDFVMYGRNVYGKKEKKGSPEDYRRQRLEELNKLPGIKVHNYLFKNDHHLTFTDVSEEWGMTGENYSNGSVYGDLDNDGDLDIAVNNLDGPSYIYENQSNLIDSGKAWLRVNLKGPDKNRNGLGAKIYVWQEGSMQFNYFSPYRGYLSTVEHVLHFGIKDAQVDSINIVWPDGKIENIKSVAPKQVITLDYKNAGDGKQTENTIIRESLFTPVFNSGIAYKHKEDEFTDFKLQPLLPHMHSRDGPGLAVGDVNGDGYDDFFVGGATGSRGNLFLQQGNGKFIQKAIDHRNFADDMGALLFDADNDGDLDLYIAAGGALPRTKENRIYAHRLYINDGKANFTLLNDGMPLVVTPASGVIAADYDRDNDLDLFICGRVSPGEYPYSPKSVLLRNDSKEGKCIFTDATATAGANLSEAGMISCALWSDFDGDGFTDLIATGEFMGVKFFRNEGGKFKDVTDQTGLVNINGWWNSLAGGDFDKDGDIDYMAGNLGLNGPYRASAKEPVCIYANDYDENGRLDPIMCHFVDGKEYMVHARDDINRQMVPMRGRFRDYNSYASVTLQEAMRKEEIEKAFVVKAERFENSYIENLGGGKFSMHTLPLEAQFSPIFGMVADDFDGDGHQDVLAVGNSYSTEVQTGRYDAQGSLFLKGDGKGKFTPDRTMLNVNGDNKSVVTINKADGSSGMIIGTNSDSLKMFSINNRHNRIRLLSDESYAMITDKNNKVYRQELYYGHSYLSQGSRTLLVPVNVKSISIFTFSGKKRVINY